MGQKWSIPFDRGNYQFGSYLDRMRSILGGGLGLGANLTLWAWTEDLGGGLGLKVKAGV